MNLHDIIPKKLVAWVWYYLMGGNGRYVGGRHIDHLYEIQRGEPPAMGDADLAWRMPPRYYWRPWGKTPPWDTDFRAAALCGLRNIHTQARFIRIGEVRGTDQPGPHSCPDCIEIAGNRGIRTTYRNVLIAEDPWTHIRQDERNTTPDPVTGL